MKLAVGIIAALAAVVVIQTMMLMRVSDDLRDKTLLVSVLRDTNTGCEQKVASLKADVSDCNQETTAVAQVAQFMADELRLGTCKPIPRETWHLTSNEQQ
jgi:hypothetical protein